MTVATIKNMKTIKFILIFLIWLIPASILCFLLCMPKYGSSDLNEGFYTIKSKDFECILQITNGVFKTICLKNIKKDQNLFLSGNDFSIKVGLKKDLGWIKHNDNQTFSSRSAKLITPDKLKPCKFIKQKNYTSFLFIYEPLNLTIKLDFFNESRYNIIHKSISINSNNENELVIEELSLGNWKIDGVLKGGGKGLPVFVDDIWFFSGETPWLDSIVSSNNIYLVHHPSAFIKKGDIWTSDSMIIGGGCQNAKAIFKDYLKDVILPPKFFTLYNTWFDLREKDLNVTNIFNVFSELSDKLGPFDTKIDYCVIDDGWFYKNSLYETNTNQFPNGLRELSNNLLRLNSELGLWLAYSGLYLDNSSLKLFNYEEAHKDFYCLCGSNYFTALSKKLSDLIKKDNIKFFKHDFNFFSCMSSGHGHLRNIIHSEEANMRQTAKLLDYERSLNPDIIQAITTGINLSPWWLKFANILWMGGGDIDFDYKYPVTSRAEAEMNYRDGKLYEILHDDQTFVPLFAIMTHGIIDGKLNTIGPWLDVKQWSDYVMNYLGRGTSIRELFVYPLKLDKIKTEVLAKGLNWANNHNEQMLNSEMILGDPRKNEVYGFRGHDDKDNVYVSIRNPKFTDEEIIFDDLGIDSKYFIVSYPYQKLYKSKDVNKFIIPAESVLIFESFTPSLFDKLKKSISVDEISIINKKAQISQLKNIDNNFFFNIDLPDNATADLVLTFNNKVLTLNLTDNDVLLEPEKKVSFPESKWRVDIFSLSKGSHTINGIIPEDTELKESLKIQVRVKYKFHTSDNCCTYGKLSFPSDAFREIIYETHNLL